MPSANKAAHWLIRSCTGFKHWASLPAFNSCPWWGWGHGVWKAQVVSGRSRRSGLKTDQFDQCDRSSFALLMCWGDAFDVSQWTLLLRFEAFLPSMSELDMHYVHYDVHIRRAHNSRDVKGFADQSLYLLMLRCCKSFQLPYAYEIEFVWSFLVWSFYSKYISNHRRFCYSKSILNHF